MVWVVLKGVSMHNEQMHKIIAINNGITLYEIERKEMDFFFDQWSKCFFIIISFWAFCYCCLNYYFW
jgi:hypothetical protein